VFVPPHVGGHPLLKGGGFFFPPKRKDVFFGERFSPVWGALAPLRGGSSPKKGRPQEFSLQKGVKGFSKVLPGGRNFQRGV